MAKPQCSQLHAKWQLSVKFKIEDAVLTRLFKPFHLKNRSQIASPFSNNLPIIDQACDGRCALVAGSLKTAPSYTASGSDCTREWLRLKLAPLSAPTANGA